MRARILLRNSTDKQAKAGTVAAQRAPVRKLAASLGATEIVEYVEEAVSGAAPLDERDVLRRLLADARPGEIVAAFDMSRLTRSDDWIERYTVLGHLRRARLRPATVDDGEIDLHSIGGRITAHVRGEIAADERSKIRDRMMAGKAAAAAQGRKPQGATPWGLRYDRTAKTWSIDEQRATIVREVHRRALEGETLGALAADLNRRGVPPIRGRAWHTTGVWRLLTGTVYRGEWTFAGHAIRVPAIVDAATWQAVQAQLLAAGKRGLRRTTHVYLLDDGLGRCEACGGPLHVRWGGSDGRTSYYHCPARCGGWRRTDATDAEVWQRIATACRRRDLVARTAADAGGYAEDAATGEADAAGFERRLARLDEVEAAILARYRRGIISEGGMEREAQAIARERAMLRQSAEAARKAAALARAGAQAAEALREAGRGIAAALADADAEERRVIVRALRPDVRVGRTVEITFRLRAPGADVVPIGVAFSTCSCTESQCATDNVAELTVKA